MYLKKLEILGFKSFANKTNINFSGGITAIVGPNGCGKTNILDALRWVLGEQRVSLLRGSKMEEVIFNGTRDMKALGMSEVTLTLVNNRGVLPTEYTEVQITRRLFRSGESEYLLNKVPCRLKDISELFYDTGVGAHSYSVIQQDMIEAVISDKAEERRFLFEEAAGITKYKQRKKAALRKLEATENDFLRLNDIYAEVKTQVNSLRRQQKKAERYQEILDNIKVWELYLGSKRVTAVEQEKREQRAAYDALKDQLTEKETALDMLNSQLEAERNQQIDIEHNLAQVGNDVYEISEKIHSIEKDVSILQEKKSNSAGVIQRNDGDIDALKKRFELLTQQHGEVETALGSQKVDLASIDAELRSAETILAEADQRLLAARSAKENENKLLIELEGKLSSGKTEEDNLRTSIDETREQIEHLEKQLQENQTQQKALDLELVGKRQQIEQIESTRTARETSYRKASQKLEELLVDSDDLVQELSNISASIEACQARKSLLEDMIVHYEGYESGVKAAMEVKERWSGIYGTVAEKFVPVAGLEVTVEAALGEMAKFLICDSRSTAESIISYLKQENKGKIGILVPDSGTLNPAVKRPEIDLPGFIGWLDALVETDDTLKPLMQAVLSRTAVFESGTRPDDLLERLPYGFKAVSTTGDVYSKNIVAGGSDDSHPLFRRKERVLEQDQMISALQQQFSEVKSTKDRITAEVASLRAEMSDLSQQLESLSEETDLARSSFNETEYLRRTAESELSRLDREKKALIEKLQKTEHRQYSLGLDFSQLANRRENLVSTIAQSSEQLGDCELAAARAQQKVSDLQVKLVESRSRIEQTENKMRHILELQQEITSTIDAKAREIDEARQQITMSEERIHSFETDLKSAFERRKEVTAQQGTLRSQQSEILERVREKEKRIKEVRAERERANESIHHIDIRLNTLESESRSVSERIREEYDIDVQTIEAACPDENMSDEQALNHLHEMKERLKAFGAVNLLALEEYKTASEREQFLREQLTDLTTAKNDLQATIIKINSTARDLFQKTFEHVKVNFKNLFVELFTGGEADIFLKDPSDPLESDIEIIARPRGKKLLSITMMSGGERALTAISLLFSLYLVKPSPFCILDEIDAPLDDANCHRFLKIIRTFSAQTQFIIITHNKISMEAAHNLYGVTMEQFGISKLVAVKFTDSGDDNMADQFVVPHDSVDVQAEAEPVVAEADEPSNGSKAHQDSTETVDDVPPKIVERLNQSITPPVTDDVDGQ